MSLDRALTSAYAANEQKIAAGITIPVQIDADATLRVEPFNRFCSHHGVRNCPAAPKVVAAWVRAAATGMDPDQVVGTLSAVELLHDVHGLSNPVATSVVRAELEKVLGGLEAPRSWPRHDQLRWVELPVWTRGIIWKREQDRERALRNKQNQLAEELKRLRGADKPAEESKADVTQEK